MRTRLTVALSCILVAAVATGGAAAFNVSDKPPPPGVVGIPYKFVFEPEDGAPPYTFSFFEGELPPGLKVEEDGTFQGTPTRAGTFVFTIKGTQCCGQPSERGFSVTIRDKLDITTASLRSATVNQAYSAPLSVIGNGGKGMVWTVSAGTLPPGLTIAPDGTPGDTTITGTPTTVGTSTFTVKVADTDGFMPSRAVTKQFTLAVVAPLVVAPAASQPTGIVGKAYAGSPVTVAGGLSPHTWAVAGGTIPPGLALDPATGTLQGRPTAAGSFAFSVRVTDADGRSAAADVAIRVVAALDLVTKKLRAATVGERYRAALRAVGGQAPKRFSVTGGKLPAGLKLNARTGVISGVPKGEGTFRFRVTVTDGLGQRSFERLRLVVHA